VSASTLSPIQQFPRTAGIAIPLFSLRGKDDVGTGAILDLVPFIDWLHRWHQGVVQLLPINESAPDEASPYNALSAFAIDPTYISTGHVPDIAKSLAARQWLSSPQVRRKLAPLADATHRVRRGAHAFKLRLLEFGFGEFQTRGASTARGARFADFCRRNAWWLDDYALFRALKERRQWTSWETWPQPVRRRDPATLQRVRATMRTRISFGQYIQWIAAEQWQEIRAHARACGVLIKGDLPFVCARDSADVWAHQDLFDPTSSAGAPPDEFSATGQRWNLPLYDWNMMRAADYQWWRQRVRQARELYDLFRIDHVIGLYRTFAIPTQDGGAAGFVPNDEAAQLRQGTELMTAILHEAPPARVMAEDLGTVPAWARASLTGLGIPGYKVFRWEWHDGAYLDPRTYPPLSVATTGTHDTDALSAWWDGLSVDPRMAILRLLDLDAQDAAHASLPLVPLLRRLYEAGSLLTILPIQDVLGWPERINVPATTTDDNWTYRLPVETAHLDERPEIRERMEIARALIDRTGRNTCTDADA